MPNLSDTKISKELNEEDLKQVSGGYSVEGDIEYFEVDDCFKDGFSIYVITQNANSQSSLIYADVYDDRGSSYVFIRSAEYPPQAFKAIEKEYIGKKTAISYNLTGK